MPFREEARVIDGTSSNREGDRYDQDRPFWPEGSTYRFRQGHHALHLFVDSPSPRVVRDVRQGLAEFGLLVHRDVVVFLYRFGVAIPWTEALFSPTLLLDRERAPVPDVESGERDRLTILLVDAHNGIICVERELAFSSEFTRELRTALRIQAALVSGDDRYGQAVVEFYQRYPNSTAMLAAAIVKTTAGGTGSARARGSGRRA